MTEPPDAPRTADPDAPVPVVPTPRPPTPRPPTPQPPAPQPQAPTPEVSASEHGRVGSDGTVYVTTSAGERVVGQWPEGDPTAALAFYRLRYDGLVAEVDLLAKRIEAGALSPEDATSQAASVRETVTSAQAVGDLDALVARLDSLAPAIAERRRARKAEKAAKLAEAKKVKSTLVEEAEQLAQGSDWRSGANRMRQLLDQWKSLPRLDKPTDDALWHRFSSARTTYTRQRKLHFSALNEKREAAKAVKEKLVVEAEACASSTDWSATGRAYRDLMTKWKAAGGAHKDVDDALWRRFRAAQDTFFGARDAASSKLDEEFAANAEVKRALLVEAEKLLPVDDPRVARDTFRQLAERWDAAGKVPREQMKALEDRFKHVEQEVRGAEDDRWQRSNPEGHARATDTVAKLEESLASLQADLDKAEAAGNTKKAAEARAGIEARRSWLDQARKSLTDFSP